MPRAYLLTLNRGATLLALLFTMLFASTVQAADEPKLSISGYDPVAYFTDGRPVPGNPEFQYVWRKLRWQFASGEHRDLFIKDPQRYAPQYDGYCAMGAADPAAAHKDTVDPNAWAIVDGKLYLVHTRYWLEQWRQKAEEYIKQADKEWQTIADLDDPIIVGSPCAAAPPTTLVALRDGKRLLMIGTQVPRNQDGKVVGKGDMRAQMEQTFQNLDRCLKAAGATWADVVKTNTFVTDFDEFQKCGDIRMRYLGVATPTSTTVGVTRLAGPDFMIEIEVVAVVNS